MRKKQFIDGYNSVKYQEFGSRLILQDTKIYVLPKRAPIEGCLLIKREKRILCPDKRRHPVIEGRPAKGLCSPTARCHTPCHMHRPDQ